MQEGNNISNEVRFLILTIIENDGNIEELRTIGYNYQQITNLIKEEVKIGNATFVDNNLQLTDVGREVKKQLSEKLEYVGIEKLISPKISSFIEDHNEDVFFIPSEKELPD